MKSEGLFELQKWVEGAGANAGISRALMARLTSWAFNAQAHPQWPQAQEALEALKAQGGVGWAPPIEGCIAKEWSEAQGTHCKLVGPQRSGRRWAVELIKKLLSIAWGLWERRSRINNAKSNQETLHSMTQAGTKIQSQRRFGPGSMPPEHSACSQVKSKIFFSHQHVI